MTINDAINRLMRVLGLVLFFGGIIGAIGSTVIHLGSPTGWLIGSAAGIGILLIRPHLINLFLTDE